MANPIRAVMVPRDSSIPAENIPAPEWIETKERLGAVAGGRYRVMDPALGQVAVGDGVTDDHAAIQGRLDMLPTSPSGGRGGKVELTPGHVYAISQTLEITLPNTDLDGVVGGTLTDMGACTIKALPGFTGPLIKINIGSGSKGAWIRNLRLDGSGEPGVTAGIEYAEGTISTADLDNVAIANVPIGIKTGRNCQSLRWNRIYAFHNIEVGLDIGPWNRHIVIEGDSRIGGTYQAFVIGGATDVPGERTQTIIFNDCELYTVGTSAQRVGLVRSSETTRFINCYIEMAATQSTVVDSLVRLGTDDASAQDCQFIGCRFGGNSKVNHAVTFWNALRPAVLLPSFRSILQPETVRVVDPATYGIVIGAKVTVPTGLLLAVGDTGPANPGIKTPLRVEYDGTGKGLMIRTAANEVFSIETPTTSGDSAALLLVNDGGVMSLKRVRVGAPDSGGTGYRVLRVLN